MDVWEPTPQKPVISTPATVSRHAERLRRPDQWMDRNPSRRDVVLSFTAQRSRTGVAAAELAVMAGADRSKVPVRQWRAHQRLYGDAGIEPVMTGHRPRADFSDMGSIIGRPNTAPIASASAPSTLANWRLHPSPDRTGRNQERSRRAAGRRAQGRELWRCRISRSTRLM